MLRQLLEAFFHFQELVANLGCLYEVHLLCGSHHVATQTFDSPFHFVTAHILYHRVGCNACSRHKFGLTLPLEFFADCTCARKFIFLAFLLGAVFVVDIDFVNFLADDEIPGLDDCLRSDSVLFIKFKLQGAAALGLVDGTLP